MRTLLHWIIITALVSIGLGFLITVLRLSIIASFTLVFIGLIIWGLAVLDRVVTNGKPSKISECIISSVRGVK